MPRQSRRQRVPPPADPLRRRPRLEPLEDRRLLANMTVRNLNDVVNGTVTSIAALVASDGGDGISLREAVVAANADNTDPADTIDFSVSGIIQLTNVLHVGEIVINNDLTINGPGAGLLTIRAFAGTAAAGDGARIFNVDDGNVATFKDVSISGLMLTGADSGGAGGAIRMASENLTISGCTISVNRAATGGGIANNSGGHLTVSGSTISGNTATGRGGGIETVGGSLSVSQSIISGNSSVGNGGGVYGTSSTIVIDSSTISGNSSTNANGGGVFHTGVGILATITGSTISGNSARSDGGGVAAVFSDVIVRHSTITGNRADSDANGTGNGGGVFVNSVASNATIDHTIVAGNLRQVSTRSDAFGPLTARFSLIGDNTGAIITNQGGNQIGSSGLPINPLLGPLHDNGGLTFTHALLAGSPALDRGDPAFVAPPANDQRGAPFVRVVEGDSAAGARIDMGAYERQTLPGLSLTVDTLLDEVNGNYSAGDLSLREAISLANGSVGDSESITFAASIISGGPVTILLTHGELTIGESLTISGPGASLLTIDASGSDPTPATKNGDGSRVFNIDDGAASLQSVTLQGLTLTNADSPLALALPGGAIFSAENLSVANCVINGNSGGNGGGIHSAAGSSAPNSLTVRYSTISGNHGGGVSQIYGRLVIEQTTIANNGGSGISTSSAQVDIRGTTVANNSAGSGAGMLISNGSATIIGSTISGNRAATNSFFATSSNGGGIFSSGANLTLAHCTITNNSAEAISMLPPAQARGGGLFINGTAVLDHTIVAHNTVDAQSAEEGPDIFGSVSASFSLIRDPSGAAITNNGGNLIGFSTLVNPMLGALADNAGPTMTHALLPGSPAINAGDPSFAGLLDYDQRGVAFERVVGGRIDMGAFEVGAISANFDGDDEVGGADFLFWQRGFGLTEGATRLDGNVDGDGDVDADDLAVWKSEFGSLPDFSATAQAENVAVASAARAAAARALAADAMFASGEFGLMGTQESFLKGKRRGWRRG